MLLILLKENTIKRKDIILFSRQGYRGKVRHIKPHGHADRSEPIVQADKE